MAFSTRPVVDDQGIPTREFRTWISLMPIQGNGVPTMSAPAGTLYTDLDGLTGARLYSSNGDGVWILA